MHLFCSSLFYIQNWLYIGYRYIFPFGLWTNNTKCWKMMKPTEPSNLWILGMIPDMPQCEAYHRPTGKSSQRDKMHKDLSFPSQRCPTSQRKIFSTSALIHLYTRQADHFLDGCSQVKWPLKWNWISSYLLTCNLNQKPDIVSSKQT